MKVGIIVPDRNDRPKFLMNYFRMMKKQSVEHSILVVQHPPVSDDCDITYRYRVGYEKMNSFRFDILFFMENDDWYAPNYIESMLNMWKAKGQPDLFGIDYSIYYHIKSNNYLWWVHQGRSSANCIMIKPRLKINWPADNFNFLDMWLYQNNHKLVKAFCSPVKPICVGIKHGEGKVGGIAHEEKNTRYDRNDKDLSFLKETVDKESFDFYTNYFK